MILLLLPGFVITSNLILWLVTDPGEQGDSHSSRSQYCDWWEWSTVTQRLQRATRAAASHHTVQQTQQNSVPLLLFMCAVNEVSKARQDKEQGFSNNISSVNVDFYSYTQRAGEDVSGLNILTTVHSSLQRKFLQCQVWKYWSALWETVSSEAGWWVVSPRQLKACSAGSSWLGLGTFLHHQPDFVHIHFNSSCTDCRYLAIAM